MEIEPPDTWVCLEPSKDVSMSDLDVCIKARMACITNSFTRANLTRLSKPLRMPVSRPEVRGYPEGEASHG